MLVALVIAILSTISLLVLILRRGRATLTLIAGIATIISWLFVAINWLADQWVARVHISLPSLRQLVVALFLAVGLILAARMLKKKLLRTISIVLAAVCFSTGMGWLAGKWSGILAITMPSLMILFVGLLALPPFVLPVPPYSYKLPTAISNALHKGPDVLYKKRRWNTPGIISVIYTSIWSIGLWSGGLELNLVSVWVYAQGLLLIFRPAFHIKRAEPSRAALVMAIYAVALLLIVNLSQGSNVPSALTPLALAQGVFVLSSYTLPLKGRLRLWPSELSMPASFVIVYLVTVSTGMLDSSLTNGLTLALALAVLLLFWVPDRDKADRWIQWVENRSKIGPGLRLGRLFRAEAVKQTAIRTINWATPLLALAIVTLYLLTWLSGTVSRTLQATGFEILVYGVTGVTAIFLPAAIIEKANKTPAEGDGEKHPSIYVARWKIAAALAIGYTMLWLTSMWTGRLEMDVLGFWLYLQVLLLIFRPAFPMRNAASYLPIILWTAYGFLAALVWRGFRGFDLTTLNLLILAQGLYAVSCYALPLESQVSVWLMVPLSAAVGGIFLAAMSMERIAATAPNGLILLLSLLALWRFVLPSQKKQNELTKLIEKRADEQPDTIVAEILQLRLIRQTMVVLIRWAPLLLAFVQLFVFYLIWGVGWTDWELEISLFNTVVFFSGMLAIFMPAYVKPAENAETFKAIITYNLGTNYPYKQVANGKLVSRAQGRPFSKLLAGPGIVLSDADHAVAVRGGGNFKRVSPPGVTFTHVFETVEEILDLRPQFREMFSLKATTKDGIDVTVETILNFRLAFDRAVALAHGGHRAVVARYGGQLQVWNLQTWHRTVSHRTGSIIALATTGDGRQGYSISDNGTFSVWDLSRGRANTLVRHSGISAIAVTPDGNRAILGLSDGTLQLWDMENTEPIGILNGHKSEVVAVAITPNGRKAVSVCALGNCRVWDLAKKKQKQAFADPADRIQALAVTPDGQHAVSASSRGALKMWNLKNGQGRPLVGRHAEVQAVSITGDGSLVFSAASDGSLKAWKLETGEEEASINSDAQWGNPIAVANDGRRVMSVRPDGSLTLWYLETWHRDFAERLEGHIDWVRALGMTPDGRHAVSVSTGGHVKAWDLELGRVVAAHQIEDCLTVHAVAITSDGRQAITGASDGTLKIWDMKTGEEVHTLGSHGNWIRSVSIARDGGCALSVSSDGALKVWNLRTQQLVRTIATGLTGVQAVTFTPSGDRAVLAASDSTLRVWKLDDEREERILADNERRLRTLALGHDKRHIVALCSDGDLVEWDIDGGPASTCKITEDWKPFFSDPAPELGFSFPYDPDAIRRTIHAQRVDQKEETLQGWDSLICQACERVVRDIIAEYTLDELVSRDQPSHRPRTDIARKMQKRLRIHIQQQDWGLELVKGRIRNIVPSQKVLKKRIEAWKAPLESELISLQAGAEMEEKRLIETARASAYRELFKNITAGLDNLQALGRQDRKKLTALALMESVKRLATGEADVLLPPPPEGQSPVD